MSDPYTGLTQDGINNILYDYSYLYHLCSDLTAATDYKSLMGITSSSPPWVSEGPAIRKLITILPEDVQISCGYL